MSHGGGGISGAWNKPESLTRAHPVSENPVQKLRARVKTAGSKEGGKKEKMTPMSLENCFGKFKGSLSS